MEIESLSLKTENQIIVKRLFEPRYDAKGLRSLELKGYGEAQ